MKSTPQAWVAALFVCAATLSDAAASPYVPAALSNFENRAIFSPTNGYARAYGNCYDALQAMRDLRGAFWDTPDGKALLVNPAFVNYWHVFDTYIETPCHLCESVPVYYSYKEPCATMATSMDQDWQAVQQSPPWLAGLRTPTLQQVFAGWRTFTACMGNR